MKVPRRNLFVILQPKVSKSSTGSFDDSSSNASAPHNLSMVQVMSPLLPCWDGAQVISLMGNLHDAKIKRM
jgi:hypothetical protein